MDLDLRNANIGLAVGIVVLVIGCILFKDSGEDALQLVGLAMLITGFGTMSFLDWWDERDERRRERDQ